MDDFQLCIIRKHITQWRIQGGGGAESAAAPPPPPFFGRFFFFCRFLLFSGAASRNLDSRPPPPPFSQILDPPLLIILHEINMIIVTHPTTFVHCFRVLFFFLSGTHCKGVSKQFCIYHLYRNVFLTQTRIRSHLGCIFLFRNSFQYPQSNRDSKRVSKHLSRVVAFIIDFSVSRVRVTRKALSLRSCIAQFHPKHNAVKGSFKRALRLSPLQKRVSGSNAYQIALFSAFQKGVSNPIIKTALRLSSAKITLKVVGNLNSTPEKW